ncbi:Nitrogen permease regulator-like 2 [Blastocladiella emersonii ATCC 22665]|nr:Nitrogen permease regulator-like 2 [Blastocladiella emersonii ATCC 22665]
MAPLRWVFQPLQGFLAAAGVGFLLGTTQNVYEALAFMVFAHYGLTLLFAAVFKHSLRDLHRDLAIGTATAALTIVMFGAPLSRHHTETLYLSVFISIRILAPAIRSMIAARPEDEPRAPVALADDADPVEALRAEFPARSWWVRIRMPAKVAVAATLLASTAYTLDWDRWWQQYPFPTLVGCEVGVLLGVAVQVGMTTAGIEDEDWLEAQETSEAAKQGKTREVAAPAARALASSAVAIASAGGDSAKQRKKRA